MNAKEAATFTKTEFETGCKKLGYEPSRAIFSDHLIGTSDVILTLKQYFAIFDPCRAMLLFTKMQTIFFFIFLMVHLSRLDGTLTALFLPHINLNMNLDFILRFLIASAASTRFSR